jgi:hypothetical protein
VRLALVGVLLPACGKRRKTCYPVRGRVLVNGKPAKDLVVLFNPKEEEAERLAPNAQTDANGEFQLSTYVEQDGAPAGDYLVTFTWRERSGLLKNQFDGPDRLKGRYGDPKKALFPVTIEKRPTELPEFRLEVK